MSVCLYYFPISAVTNHYKLIGLKYQKCIILLLWKSEVENKLAGLFLLEDRRESVFLLFQLLEAACTIWFMVFDKILLPSPPIEAAQLRLGLKPIALHMGLLPS